jgi:hypothetical protein
MLRLCNLILKYKINYLNILNTQIYTERSTLNFISTDQQIGIEKYK